MQLPPVLDRDGKASENIARNVNEADLCKAVTALKKLIDGPPIPTYLQPGDWARVRSINVGRTPMPGHLSIEGDQYQLHLAADIPGRPWLVGVMMSKPTAAMQFFTANRLSKQEDR